jgi:hypothetical protein
MQTGGPGFWRLFGGPMGGGPYEGDDEDDDVVQF